MPSASPSGGTSAAESLPAELLANSGITSERIDSPECELTLPSRIAAHRWFHTMDLGGGLRTVGIHDPLTRLPLLGLPESLAGLSVLDVGAWDGFFAFECERRGATRVVASDHFSWHGPGWGTKAGFEMAREALGSRVEDIDIDVMDLSPERIGTFDLVLFLGVLYHLRDPLGGS